MSQESNKLKHQQQQENRSTSGPLSNQTRDEEDEGVEEEEEGPIINPTQQSQKVCLYTLFFFILSTSLPCFLL